MEIQLATPDDAEIVSALNAEVQRVHADALPQLFKQPSPETFPASAVTEVLADPENFVYIASLNQEPVGYVYAQLLHRAETPLTAAWDRVYIHHLAVKPAQQRQGVGHALIQRVVALAREKSIRTVALDVWTFNTPARRFFITQGFTVYNERLWLEVEKG